MKYGIGDLAKKLDITEATARVHLRRIKEKKVGKSYGWNTDKELAAVVRRIEA